MSKKPMLFNVNPHFDPTKTTDGLSAPLKGIASQPQEQDITEWLKKKDWGSLVSKIALTDKSLLNGNEIMIQAILANAPKTVLDDLSTHLNCDVDAINGDPRVVLHRMFTDRLPASSDLFTVSGAKLTGVSAGKLQSRTTDNMPHMVKPVPLDDKLRATTDQKDDTCHLICEQVFGPLFERGLPGRRSPNIQLVTDPNARTVAIGSQYLLHGFKTVAQMSPSELLALKNAKGGADALVMSFLLGNFDMNDGNIGCTFPNERICILDFGFAGTQFYNLPRVMGTQLAHMVNVVYPHLKKIPINIQEFIGKTRDPLFTDDLIKQHIRDRLDQLRDTGFELPGGFDFSENRVFPSNRPLYPDQELRFTGNDKASWKALEDFLIDSTIRQRDTLKKLGNALECYLKAGPRALKTSNVEQQEEWKNIGWIRAFEINKACDKLDQRNEGFVLDWSTVGPDDKSSFKKNLSALSESEFTALQNLHLPIQTLVKLDLDTLQDIVALSGPISQLQLYIHANEEYNKKCAAIIAKHPGQGKIASRLPPRPTIPNPAIKAITKRDLKTLEMLTELYPEILHDPRLLTTAFLKPANQEIIKFLKDKNATESKTIQQSPSSKSMGR